MKRTVLWMLPTIVILYLAVAMVATVDIYKKNDHRTRVILPYSVETNVLYTSYFYQKQRWVHSSNLHIYHRGMLSSSHSSGNLYSIQMISGIIDICLNYPLLPLSLWEQSENVTYRNPFSQLANLSTVLRQFVFSLWIWNRFCRLCYILWLFKAWSRSWKQSSTYSAGPKLGI